MTLCIDTNVLFGMFGRNAPWLAIRQALLDGRLIWALSSEILLEYEEIALREVGQQHAAHLLRFIEILHQTRGNIRYLSPDFRFQIIREDQDDNKFADCAVVAHADFILTEDRHFRSMKNTGYKPQPLSPGDFIQCYLSPQS